MAKTSRIKGSEREADRAAEAKFQSFRAISILHRQARRKIKKGDSFIGKDSKKANEFFDQAQELIDKAKELQKFEHSTRVRRRPEGSGTFTDAEIARGFRRLKS